MERLHICQEPKGHRPSLPLPLCSTEMYGGLLLRLASASTAYLGRTSDAVDVEMTYYRDHSPSQPMLRKDVWE
ncbi:hypothetical protein EJ110_NYTH28010 [Nymphaea thermarum]|nr:hypothetical protein EJ110_NYTH28010 [Nymphaea thermarum]